MFLTLRVIRYRRSKRVSLGLDGNDELLYRVRAHGNFMEYTPLFLIILLMAELQGLGQTTLFIFAGVFIVARHIHAVAVLQNKVKLRFPGMFFSLIPIIGLALRTAVKVLFQ